MLKFAIALAMIASSTPAPAAPAAPAPNLDNVRVVLSLGRMLQVQQMSAAICPEGLGRDSKTVGRFITERASDIGLTDDEGRFLLFLCLSYIDGRIDGYAKGKGR